MLSTDCTIYRVIIMEDNCVIHWIVIYPVDSAIHLLNNWGLVVKSIQPGSLLCLTILLIFFTGWLYESSGSYHEAFFVCGSFIIASSLLVFIVSYMIRKKRRTATFRETSFKLTEPANLCVCEESIETGSEECALVGLTSQEVLVVTDRETVL